MRPQSYIGEAGFLLVIDIEPAIEPAVDQASRTKLHLLDLLSEHLPVTLLTCDPLGVREEHVVHGPRFREIRMGGADWLAGPREVLARAGIGGDTNGLALAMAVDEPNCPFALAARTLSSRATLIAHLTPFSGPIFADGDFPEVYFPAPPAVTRLDAIDGMGTGRALLKLMRLEQALCARVRRLYAGSDDALAIYHILHGVEASRLALCLGATGTGQVTATSGETAIFVEGLLNCTAGFDHSPPTVPFTLALNDYDVSSGNSGGMERIIRTLGALERPVLLLCLGVHDRVTLPAPTIVVVTIAKTLRHRRFESELDRNQPISTGDLSASLFVLDNPSMMSLVAMLAPRADLCVLEHCYMVPLCDAIVAANPAIRFVYSAHNVESVHRPIMLAEHAAGSILTPLTFSLESEALARAALVITCTPSDADLLSTSQSPALVVINGCEVDSPTDSEDSDTIPPAEADDYYVAEKPGLHSGEKAEIDKHGPTQLRVGLIGSSHRPNVEAAKFIMEELAPLHPELRFEFVGGLCDALTSGQPNVVLYGKVSKADKTRIMGDWAIALNPVHSGGGSSLKLPDYLAHRIPTINSNEGARGYDVAEAGAGIVVSRERFSAELTRLAGDEAARAALSEQAGAYARDRLSWDVVTGPYREAVARLATPIDAARLSLLVIADTYAESGTAGEDPFLTGWIQALRARFARIDLAAIDISAREPYHFAGQRVQTGRGPSARLTEIFDRSHFFAPDHLSTEPEIFAGGQAIQRAWMAERRRAAEIHAATLPPNTVMPRLLGGLYAQEQHGDVRFHWSSGCFSILVPAGTIMIELDGDSASGKAIAISLRESRGGEAPVTCQTTIAGRTRIRIAVPADLQRSPTICTFEMEEHSAPPDSRLFGITLFNAIAWQADPAALADGQVTLPKDRTIDLDDPLSDEALSSNQWPAIAAKLREERDPSIGAQLRGLRIGRSATLIAHIHATADNYDAILVADTLLGELRSVLPTKQGAKIVLFPAYREADPILSDMLFAGEEIGGSAYITVSRGWVGWREAEFRVPPRAYCVPPATRAGHDGDRGPKQPYALVTLANPSSAIFALLREASRLCRTSPNPVSLVVIGAGGDHRWDDSDGLFHLGTSGEWDEVDLYCEALAVVCIDRHVPLQADLVRAWGWMRPVLAYAAIDAAREMISPDRDGILFEDASALADGLRRIIDHEDFATALGRSGFAQAVDRYSSHAVGRAVITSLWPNIGPAGKGGARSKQKRKSGTSTKSRQPTSSSVTKAAIASEAVRPGDSIPKRLTRPGSP